MSHGFPARFGPYTLLERIGQGAMAEVLLARQEGLGGTERLLAIKRIHPDLIDDEETARSFIDEMRLASRLQHPGIGHLFDVGEVDGQYYLAMEYLRGRNLADIVVSLEAGGSPMPIELVVEIGRRVCAGLHHAHTRCDDRGLPLEIVHRDLSPDNIVITLDGEVKIVDFGIAMARNKLSRTRSGLVKGTLAYLAPEQIEAQKIDGRADLFALAVVLFQLLTGKYPFEGRSIPERMTAILESAPPSPRRLRPSCPRSLERVLLRALSKRREGRFEDAAEFEDALAGVAVHLGKPVTGRAIADYLLALLPELAEAAARAQENPSDVWALTTSSYLARAAELEDEPTVLERSPLHPGKAGAPKRLSNLRLALLLALALAASVAGYLVLRP